MDVVYGIVLAVFIFTPVLVLVHEAGHAAVGLLRTKGLVIVRVGRPPGWVRGRVGRLSFQVSPLLGRDSLVGTAQTFGRMTRRDRVVFSLAGLAAEFVVLAASVPLIFHVPDPTRSPVVWAWLLCIGHFAANLVPFEVHGVRSDGAQVLDALRDRSSDGAFRSSPGSNAQVLLAEVADTENRWIVVFTDDRAAHRTRRRELMFNGAAWALGLPTDDGPRSKYAFWHAHAGWCWRESEHGEPEVLSAKVRDAWTRATYAGFVDWHLVAATAADLARDADLGLGSPGTTGDERRGFLERAFREVATYAKVGPLDHDDRRFCFRYGVALHDVERLAPGPDLQRTADGRP